MHRDQARAICRAPTLRCLCKMILSWILDATACCDTAGEMWQHSVSGGALPEVFVRRGLGANTLSAGPSWPMSRSGLRLSFFACDWFSKQPVPSPFVAEI